MEALIRWKVVSSRPYRWRYQGKVLMMKPNQVFVAAEEDIPEEFRAMVISLSPTPTIPRVVRKEPIAEVNIPERVKAPEKPITYRIKPRGDYFDILDSKGKKVNEQKLSEDEAADMLKSLQA
jgi:hypothetical protein